MAIELIVDAHFRLPKGCKAQISFQFLSQVRL